MSPRGTKIEADGYPSTEGHVLESIFDLIGTPNHVDLSFITDKDALAYIKKFKSRPQAYFSKIFGKINSQGLNLMR